jgi:hypothetical protein
MAELSTLKSLHPILSQFAITGNETFRGIVQPQPQTFQGIVQRLILKEKEVVSLKRQLEKSAEADKQRVAAVSKMLTR